MQTGGYGAMKKFNIPSLEQLKTAKAFERALSNKPIEEQLAASIVAKNVLNGCSWEFCRADQQLKEYESEFKKSTTCKLQKVTYNRAMGVTGYLVSIKMERLLELLGPNNKGPLSASEVETAKENHIDSGAALIERIRSGYAGKIAIYHTYDTQTITIQGRTLPAYAMTLKELCVCCKKMGYGIVIGGVPRDPLQVMQREDAVIEALLLAPSSNALFIEIGPMKERIENEEQHKSGHIQTPQVEHKERDKFNKEDYWKEFIEYAFDKSGNQEFLKANFPIASTADRNWYALRVGSAKAHIELSFNTQKNTIRTALLIKDKELLEQLEAVVAKSAIRDAVSVNRESKTANISMTQSVVNLAEDRTPQFEWFMTGACAIKDIVGTVLK